MGQKDASHWVTVSVGGQLWQKITFSWMLVGRPTEIHFVDMDSSFGLPLSLSTCLYIQFLL